MKTLNFKSRIKFTSLFVKPFKCIKMKTIVKYYYYALTIIIPGTLLALIIIMANGVL